MAERDGAAAGGVGGDESREASHAKTHAKTHAETRDETVGEVAGLYLGNILYALETTALALEEQGKPDHAAFYRGIARKLAEARGRERGAPAH